jgi:osmotically-inducible protein OsmY
MTRCDLSDVECRIQTALAASPIYALRELRVSVHGSSLRLQGAVTSYYHKQLAQEIVRSLAGDLEVVNSVAVGSAPGDSAPVAQSSALGGPAKR